MKFFPDSSTLACRHPLVSVLVSVISIDVFKVIRILLEIVLFFFNILNEFLHVTKV